MGLSKEDTQICLNNLCFLYQAAGKPDSCESLRKNPKLYYEKLSESNQVELSENIYNGKIKRFHVHEILECYKNYKIKKNSIVNIYDEYILLQKARDLLDDFKICI